MFEKDKTKSNFTLKKSINEMHFLPRLFVHSVKGSFLKLICIFEEYCCLSIYKLFFYTIYEEKHIINDEHIGLNMLNNNKRMCTNNEISDKTKSLNKYLKEKVNSKGI